MTEPTEDEIKLGYIADWSTDDNLDVFSPEVDLAKAKPFTVPRSLLHAGHAHLRGRTRSGKTSRLIGNLIDELLRSYGPENNRQRDPVFIFDLGGDKQLLRKAMGAAEAAQRKFRFISLDTDHASNTFNPWQSMKESGRSALQISMFLQQSFSLDYGLIYGGSYYTKKNLSALLSVAREMEKYGETVSLEMVLAQMKQKDMKDAEEVRMCLQTMLEYPQLSSIEGREEIRFDRAIEESEVIYFLMPVLSGPTSARQVAGLGLYSALLAAMERERKQLETRHCFFVVDEFQELVSRSFASLIAQCGKFNVSLVLANQTTAQLEERDVALADVVADNTIIKQLLTVTQERDFEDLQRVSKERITTLKSKSSSQENTFLGETERELVSPTLQRNLINEVTSRAGYSFIVCDDGLGFREPTVAFTDYATDSELFKEPFKIPTVEDEPRSDVVLPIVGTNKTTQPIWKAAYEPDKNETEPKKKAWNLRQEQLRKLWEAEDSTL